jgi:hypothetical protein
MRTIPMSDWVKTILDVWIKDAGFTSGTVFRRVNRAGRVWGESMTQKVVWYVVREFARMVESRGHRETVTPITPLRAILKQSFEKSVS